MSRNGNMYISFCLFLFQSTMLWPWCASERHGLARLLEAGPGQVPQGAGRMHGYVNLFHHPLT